MALHQNLLLHILSPSYVQSHHMQKGREERHHVSEPSMACKRKHVCLEADEAEAGTNLYTFQWADACMQSKSNGTTVFA